MSDTSLTDAFNTMHPQLKSSAVLGLYNGTTWIYYDFAQRIRLTPVEGGHNTTSFAELDRDVLVAARDKLVELGGKPPQLPPEAGTLNKPARGLNP
jgi:hypothetical protein